MELYVTKPWAYPMTPPSPKTDVKASGEDGPEDIRRCLNCTLPDCKYQSLKACRLKHAG